MSLLKKILSPIVGIVPSGLRSKGNDSVEDKKGIKQSTTYYSCMYELHEYNKKKALMQNSKIEL